MKKGTCDACAQSYSYDQWQNCDCSGEVGSSKVAYVSKCVVDNPPNMCVQITNYNACGSCTAGSTSTSSPSTTTTSGPGGNRPRQT
jgi:hypothetical protein